MNPREVLSQYGGSIERKIRFAVEVAIAAG
jgi:2,4-dienoyl-CoA reductase-like NADH-dependent reductase (Old Yellow Enzyme family)